MVAVAQGCAAALLLAWGFGAVAQTTLVEPSAPQRCLTRGKVLLGSPEYPEDAYRIKEGAKVVVELSFSRADTGPRVEQIKVGGADRFGSAFEQSVRRFIDDYRVPCLRAGETAVLRQEFAFEPREGRGVALFATLDDRAPKPRASLAQCIAHLQPGTLPQYPRADLASDRQGTVVLRATFVDAQSPPDIEVLDDGGGGELAHSASTFARGNRMPCHDGAGPLSVVTLYKFRIEGGQRADVPLLMLLPSFKGIREANVYFDFNTMGCPFDVSFDPRQPVLPNEVGEVGHPNPERRFFLDWLKRQQFDLPRHHLSALFGRQGVISVPCTVINLGARQGGGGSK